MSQAELDETRGLVAESHQSLPWSIALRSTNFWTTMTVALCYVYTFYFFQSWFHTYLVKARGYSENDLLLSSLPFFVAAFANCAGGLASNLLVKRVGLKWGRCAIGVVCLGISAVCTVALMFTHGQLAAMILLSVIYAGITLQQPIMFAVCLDIGGAYAGAMVGAMNTASQNRPASFHRWPTDTPVDHYGNYNLPFYSHGGAARNRRPHYGQLKVDPTQKIVAGVQKADRPVVAAI